MSRFRLGEGALGEGAPDTSSPSTRSQQGRERVAVVGASEWGTALARVIGMATAKDLAFDDTVRMWVPPDERLHNCRLCESINDMRENTKYLPGLKLPINVVADSSLCRAVSGASLIVFAIPFQHAMRVIPCMRRTFHPGARALILVDGIHMTVDDKPVLAAHELSLALGGMSVSVLVGAELLPDIVHRRFCEVIIGCTDGSTAALWSRLLSSETMHVEIAPSPAAAELTASLVPIVALAAGFCDGVGVGDNTKAAIVRNGLLEIRRAVALLLHLPESSMALSSCGFSNVLGECYGGHSARSAKMFAQAQGEVRWERIEVALLAGCRVRGVSALHKYVRALRHAKIDHHFPQLVRVYEIALLRRPPRHIVPLAQNESQWRTMRLRRILAAALRCIGGLGVSCLLGVCVFLAQREVMCYALEVDKLGNGARETVEAAGFVAAVGCIHSCLRWGVFGIGPFYFRSVLALFVFCAAALHAALLAERYAHSVQLPRLLGWLAVVPLALGLGFAPLARAFSKQRLGDFLLTSC